MSIRIRIATALFAGVMSSFGAGYVLAATSGPTTFATAGQSRYAMVSRGPLDTATTTSTTFVDIPGLSTSIVIPSSRVAEVIVTFSGMVNTCDAMYVRALIGGTAGLPAYTQLQWNFSGGADSHAFTFYGRLKAGTYTVKMQWHGLTSCNHQFIAARSMVVTANIHP